MKHKITKAVIPVAGLGTRFYPITKVVPKELLPIVDKPALLYVMEEAIDAGIRDIILVNSPSKALISKETILVMVDANNKILRECNITIVFQDRPLGLGHAVSCAEQAVGDDWFFVLLPDVLIDARPGCTEQMVRVWNDIDCAVFATRRVSTDAISSCGVVAPFDHQVSKKTGDYGVYQDKLHKVKYVVEKPLPKDTPSNLAIIGRYLLPPSIFSILKTTKPSFGGEIQITDAISTLATQQDVYAYEFDGVFHDTGSHFGYISANLHYAMKDPVCGNKIQGLLV